MAVTRINLNLNLTILTTTWYSGVRIKDSEYSLAHRNPV